jgi:membrane fusion protein, adhesin transport system
MNQKSPTAAAAWPATAASMAQHAQARARNAAGTNTTANAAPAARAAGAAPPTTPPTAAPPNAAAQTAGDPGTRSAAVRSFEQAADEVISSQKRQRAQWITRIAGLVVLALLLWAHFARVDEITKADAKVISSRQLQLVQSLDGGVVSAIMVREGQVVEAGQVLLKIDETRATSGARENAAQGFALQARLARLRALAEGGEFSPPAHTGADEKRIVEEERSLYTNRKLELGNQQAISQQQLAQRQQELSEVQARRAAAERALSSAQDELRRTRPLLTSGAVSEVDVMRLDRDISRIRGEIDQTNAQLMRSQAAIGEAQRKLQETEITFRNEARKELAENLGRLNALNESAVALNDRVDKSQIKSPVRGRVQRLLANTVGGVVQAGKDIVEIVPLDDKLVLEAKVNPRDIAFIHPGQEANVKFTAYDSSIYGGLDAVVENISPDTVVDERGNAYYLVRVQTKKPQLGERMPIIPGMTAEVDVLTGKKSVLSYLLKPVLKVQQNALRER